MTRKSDFVEHIKTRLRGEIHTCVCVCENKVTNLQYRNLYPPDVFYMTYCLQTYDPSIP